TIAVVLVLAGLRVLDVAPAGRRLSHLAAYAWVSLNVLEAFALHEPLWMFLGGTAYPLLVEWIFLRKDWQAAFEKAPLDVTVRPRMASSPAKSDAPSV